MEEPPDPGGSRPVPPAAYYVTISNESGMDTDGSITASGTRPLKRSRCRKVCKECNKHKKKGNHSTPKTSECHCSDNDVITEKPQNEVVSTDRQTQKQNEKINIVSLQKLPNDPAPQSQTSTSVARTQFEQTDSAPYSIHVQRIQVSPNDPVSLHPIALGKFLKHSAFQNVINGSVKRLGRNRVSIAFSRYLDANAFLSHSSLADNNLKAFIPSFSITRMGLVRGVPTDLSIEDILENISVPLGCGKILKARRLNYKVMVEGSPSWKPTQTIVLTFDGQMLPKRVYMCYNALPVELYTYPTIQCYNCCRFGHTKVQCRSKPRCYKCGHEHTGDSCNIDEDHISCCLCGGIHSAINKICPESCRQKEIKISMAQNCISYAEAIKLHPAVSRPYAEVVATAKDQYISSSPSSHPSSVSYKKTVTSRPKPPPKLVKGYDHIAHQALIKQYDPPSPTNGCAFNTGNNNEETQSLTDIIISLIKLLMQSNVIKPNHAAPVIETIANLFNSNGSSSSAHGSSVELQECNKQKK